MRKLGLGLATATAVIASPATARDGAWYVGGDFGAMIVEDTDIDVGTQENAITLDSDYGIDAGLYAGYDLGTFRIEAEVAYKDADIESFSNTLLLRPVVNPLIVYPIGTHVGAGSTTALSFMVNGLLDFGDEDGISGFVGVGGGYAKVDYDSVRGYTNAGSEFINDSDGGFAWQVIAGIRQAISDNADVTLKYRYFNLDGIEPDGNLSAALDTGFSSHSLLGGITFNFGAPEEPPPPPPPTPAAARLRS
jgi:OOP family OmpA-OmpF porin